MSKTGASSKYKKDRDYNYESMQRCYVPSMGIKEGQEEMNRKIISEKLFGILKKSPKKIPKKTADKTPDKTPDSEKSPSHKSPPGEEDHASPYETESYTLLYRNAKRCGITPYKNGMLKSEGELKDNFKIMLKYIRKLEKLKENTDFTEEENIFKVDSVKEVARIFGVRGTKRKGGRELKLEILSFLD